jgi:hypothetical protein
MHGAIPNHCFDCLLVLLVLDALHLSVKICVQRRETRIFGWQHKTRATCSAGTQYKDSHEMSQPIENIFIIKEVKALFIVECASDPRTQSALRFMMPLGSGGFKYWRRIYDDQACHLILLTLTAQGRRSTLQ